MEPRTDPLGAPRAGGEIPYSVGPVTHLALAGRRHRPADRTALCVQITLCIVVSVLLFSVIALPKLRSSQARTGDTRGAPTTTRGR